MVHRVKPEGLGITFRPGRYREGTAPPAAARLITASPPPARLPRLNCLKFLRSRFPLVGVQAGAAFHTEDALRILCTLIRKVGAFPLGIL